MRSDKGVIFCSKAKQKNCKHKGTYVRLKIGTEADTPFISFGPLFKIIFDHRTSSPQSWVDVMISTYLKQKSLTSGNCLEHYALQESIFLNTTGSHRSKSFSTNRKYSFLVSLNQKYQNDTVKMVLNVFVKFTLLKTTGNLKWASVVELSKHSKKLLSFLEVSAPSS